MDKINNILKEKIKSRIVEELMKGGKSFSELLNLVELKDHGQFNYHLKQLIESELIIKDENYSLTQLGKKLGVYVNQFRMDELYPISVVCPIIKNSEG